MLTSQLCLWVSISDPLPSPRVILELFNYLITLIKSPSLCPTQAQSLEHGVREGKQQVGDLGVVPTPL